MAVLPTTATASIKNKENSLKRARERREETGSQVDARTPRGPGDWHVTTKSAVRQRRAWCGRVGEQLAGVRS